MPRQRARLDPPCAGRSRAANRLRVIRIRRMAHPARRRGQICRRVPERRCRLSAHGAGGKRSAFPTARMPPRAPARSSTLARRLASAGGAEDRREPLLQHGDPRLTRCRSPAFCSSRSLPGAFFRPAGSTTHPPGVLPQPRPQVLSLPSHEEASTVLRCVITIRVCSSFTSRWRVISSFCRWESWIARSSERLCWPAEDLGATQGSVAIDEALVYPAAAGTGARSAPPPASPDSEGPARSARACSSRMRRTSKTVCRLKTKGFTLLCSILPHATSPAAATFPHRGRSPEHPAAGTGGSRRCARWQHRSAGCFQPHRRRC